MTVLAMSISILIMWAPGHVGLSGNELADHQAKLGAADSTQQRTSYMGSSHPPFLMPPPIQHERLKVCTSLSDEQIKTSFAKTERTDLDCLHSGYHPAL